MKAISISDIFKNSFVLTYIILVMVNTVGRNVSAAIKSYTAGFLDADGAIMAPVEHSRDSKFQFRPRLVIRITQGNREILDSLAEDFGIGQVVRNMACYDWIIRDQSHVKWLLESLLPYIRVKRRQATVGLQILSLFPISSKQDLLKVASLADTLSSYNVRSKLQRHSYALKVQESFSRND